MRPQRMLDRAPLRPFASPKEKYTNSALPLMYDRGMKPQKRLSSELSRLSPIMKNMSGGTVTGPYFRRGSVPANDTPGGRSSGNRKRTYGSSSGLPLMYTVLPLSSRVSPGRPI